MSQGHEFDINLYAFSGARAHRAVHTGAMRLEQHTHDWPCLVLHLLGSYREVNESGEAHIASPAAVLHPAGVAHGEIFGEDGAEVVILKFDPAWVRLAGCMTRMERAHCWSSGRVVVAARDLAAQWSSGSMSEKTLSRATAAFLNLVACDEDCVAPSWIERVHRAFERRQLPTTTSLALELDLNRAWLARAYRTATGEGLRETARRKRVERAITLLRRTDDGVAEVAAAVGFCDQSHMNRAVRALTGRTPVQIRNERAQIA